MFTDLKSEEQMRIFNVRWVEIKCWSVKMRKMLQMGQFLMMEIAVSETDKSKKDVSVFVNKPCGKNWGIFDSPHGRQM